MRLRIAVDQAALRGDSSTRTGGGSVAAGQAFRRWRARFEEKTRRSSGTEVRDKIGGSS